MIPVSMLLKSWAIPPVSWPTASIFCAWRKRIFGALAFEHLVLQALVGLGQLFGAGADPFFQGFVEITQGFFGFFALGSSITKM
jgi:hypothetical protein